jgi:hypothetical protein
MLLRKQNASLAGVCMRFRGSAGASAYTAVMVQGARHSRLIGYGALHRGVGDDATAARGAGASKKSRLLIPSPPIARRAMRHSAATRRTAPGKTPPGAPIAILNAIPESDKELLGLANRGVHAIRTSSDAAEDWRREKENPRWFTAPGTLRSLDLRPFWCR